VLPAALFARLDWGSLELQPTSFVDERLSGRAAVAGRRRGTSAPQLISTLRRSRFLAAKSSSSVLCSTIYPTPMTPRCVDARSRRARSGGADAAQLRASCAESAR
jgi:hypothetical protein